MHFTIIKSVLLAISSLVRCLIYEIITSGNFFENQFSTLYSETSVPTKSKILMELKEWFDLFQADFATSAVDFLHRVGRTARAGQYGLVTSLYTESNRDLVDTIRRAAKLGQPVVNINSCCYKLPKYMVFGAYKALLKAYSPPPPPKKNESPCWKK